MWQGNRRRLVGDLWQKELAIGRGFQKINFYFPQDSHHLFIALLCFKNDIWTNSQNNTGDVATVYLMLERPWPSGAVDTRDSVLQVHTDF